MVLSIIKVLHNNRCTKSRNALKLLDEAKLDYEIVSYLDGMLSEKELRDIIDKLGMKPETIVRKSEAIFKENFKGKTLSDEEWIKAMLEYPKLIERPIIYDDTRAVIGRPTENINVFIK
jgi:arsenate reductase